MRKRKWWVMGVVGGLLLASPVIAAGNGPDPMPTLANNEIGFRDAVGIWLDAFVRIGGTAQEPVYIDCPDGAEEKVPEKFQSLVRALEPVSGYLMMELAPEMERRDVPFKTLVQMKLNWSPAVVALVRDAVQKAGWVPAGTFPRSGLDVFTSSAAEPECTTGRCDCIPCNPSLICDCKTSPIDKTQDCYGPRVRCSTSKPKLWIDSGIMTIEYSTR